MATRECGGEISHPTGENASTTCAPTPPDFYVFHVILILLSVLEIFKVRHCFVVNRLKHYLPLIIQRPPQCSRLYCIWTSMPLRDQFFTDILIVLDRHHQYFVCLVFSL